MIDEQELDEGLRRDCPLPSAAWRGSLRRRLLAFPTPPPRPPRLWLRVGASAGLGIALLALASVAG